MSTVCPISRFSIDKHSKSVKFPDEKEISVDQLKQFYTDFFQRTDIPFDITPSSDEDYVNSVDALCNYIKEQAKIRYEGWSDQNGQLTRHIKSLLLPRPYTAVEQAIMAEIEGTDLIREDDRRNISYRQAISQVYGRAESTLNSTRQDEFDHQIFMSTIITDNGLVTDQNDLNKAIQSYQSEQYAIMRDYLVSKYGADKLANNFNIPVNLFNNQSKYTKEYYNILTLMENLIHQAKERGDFNNLMDEGWAQYVSKKPGITFYQAVNAYINLAYFDNVLYQSLGKYISINREVLYPIQHTYENNRQISTQYRYGFAKGNAFAVKSWNTTDRDALKEMSAFSRLLITNIPVYEYDITNQRGSIAFKRMELKDFVNTISRLLDLGQQISNTTIAKAVIGFNSNPRDNFLIICQQLFGNKQVAGNKAALRSLQQLGFDDNNISYLYSIYKTLFLDSNSWNNIEQKHIKVNGLPPTYPIIDTLLGVMNSSVTNNYLQTVYDYETGQYETTIKKKFNDQGIKFDLISNINGNTIDRNDKASLMGMYQLERNGLTYNLTLPGGFQFAITPAQGYNILSKNNENRIGEIVTISNFPVVDDEFRLSLFNPQEREKLINGENLTDNQQKIMTILRFIDNMLSTTFATSQQSLQRLGFMLAQNRGSGFRDMFKTAVRALVITDIYNQLDNAKKKDGSNYIKRELVQFLDDNPDVFGFTLDPNDKDGKQYFVKRIDGNQLKTVYAGENWLSYYAYADAILTGVTSKSTISNLEGAKIPNYSPLYMGAKVNSQIRKSAGFAADNLLFDTMPIKSVTINTDVQTIDGKRKSISNLTYQELLYDSIVNKFINTFKDDTIYVQPTTYSDKTKIITYGLTLSDIIKGKLKTTFTANDFNAKVIKLMQDTIYKMYNGVLDTVIADFNKLNEFAHLYEPSINRIQNLRNIQQWLTTHTYDDLRNQVLEYNRTHPDKLAFGETHFRPLKGHMTLNETLIDYALITPTQLATRLQQEKVGFLKELLSNRVTFPIKRNRDNIRELASSGRNSNGITEMLKQFSKDLDPLDWVYGNNMVLAKRPDGTNILSIADVTDDMILNPILDRYFMLDNLLGNNLRLSLTGAEYNHPTKVINSLNFDNQEINFYKNQIKFSDQPTLIDIQLTLAENNPITMPQLYQYYRRIMTRVESDLQKTQFKRNVPIPGTIRPYLPNCIDGIGSTVNVAVFRDVTANMYNYSGVTDRLKVHDGAAFESPITSLLENKALQDNEVGTVKKPLHHYYDPRLGTSVLLKYAVTTITNQEMRRSDGNNLFAQDNGIRLYNLFKKMHNVKWSQTLQNTSDLLLRCDYKVGGKIDFITDIVVPINGGLFYKRGNKHYKLVGFGKQDNAYYTQEVEVDEYGNPFINTPTVTKYHYFDANSNHIISNTILNNPDLHTIDSLFELHSAMGGIFSESLNNSGQLQYSEASNQAVFNFVNATAYKKVKEGETWKLANTSVTQSEFDQPLKRCLVDIVANETAVKNGTSNVNPSSSFYDDSELSYMTLGTEYYGTQQDTDHDADEAQMTEFSQVINALDSNGYMHEYVSEIYDALGRVAIQMSEVELDAVDAFRTAQDKSKLYDVVGRTLISGMANKLNGAGIAQAILNKIEATFNLNINHELDKIKIPFSDPNIYSQFFQTIVSSINSKSIKRKYPGLGAVLVPGYNIAMHYVIGNQIYQYEDLVKRASGYTSTATNTSDYNRDIVRQYLEDKQAEQPNIDASEVIPGDKIVVTVQVPGVADQIVQINLQNISDYYAFKENPVAYIANKFGYVGTITSIQQDVRQARDLAPQRLYWTLDNGTRMSIYDHWKIKELFQYLDSIKDNPEFKQLAEQKRRELDIQKAFTDVKRGVYVDRDNIEHKISNVTDIPAQTIVPNIYKTRFGIKDSDSLADVLERGPSYFNQGIQPITSNNYDIAYTKKDGKHLYITFKPIQYALNDNFDAHQQYWTNTQRVKRKSDKVRYSIYAMSSNHLKQFEVGRLVVRDDLSRNQDGKIINTNTQKEVRDKYKYEVDTDGKVLERIYFVNRYQVVEDDGGVVQKYITYNIDRTAIKQALDLDDENAKEKVANEFISKGLLPRIYESDEFNGIVINSTVTKQSHVILYNTLSNLATALSYDKELSNYLMNLQEAVHNGKEQGNMYQYSKLKSLRNQYARSLAEKQYASFLKSLSFTGSRIPAQDLQSFMKQLCVGFTGANLNHCYVSHFQTWLQGSDYDIDKSFLMGFSFDANGRYIGWSSLFDYSTVETINASEYLPIPRGGNFVNSDTGINIDEDIQSILSVNGAERVREYAKLIKKLYNSNRYDVTWTVNGGDEVFENLNKHEHTKLPTSLLEDAYKNFISSHIQNVIEDPTSMVKAYSPIIMDDIDEAAEKSPQNTEKYQTMTLYNPATKFYMQYQNMLGKKTVGINANGAKGCFMWHYYLADVLAHPTDDGLRYASFNYTLNNIKGRASGNPQQVTVNMLPDIAWDAVSDENKQLYVQALQEILHDEGIKQERPKQPASSVNSQLISAATDNAKVLYLPRINAGSKMGKMYLFLNAIGLDILDVSSFMTSPVVSFINEITEGNIFTQDNIKLKHAIAIAGGDFSSMAGEDTLSMIANDEVLDIRTQDTANKVKMVQALRQQYMAKTTKEQWASDLQTFSGLTSASDEFSTFTQVLSINQGIKTSKVDFNNVVERLKQEYAKTGAPELDIIQFMFDDNYAKEVKDNYNERKICINVFDVITRIPQIRDAFKLLAATSIMDHNLTVKSAIYDEAYADLKPAFPYMSEIFQKNLLRAIDNVFIRQFLRTLDYAIPYPANSTLYNADKSSIKAPEPGLLRLHSIQEIASFKDLFENVIIPNLKRGKVYDFNNGNVIERSVPELVSNDFIQSLIRTNDRFGMPFYRCELNMRTIEESNDSKIRFHKYLTGLQALTNIRINNIPLSDLFALYNLIVNKNQFGDNRLTTLFDAFVRNKSQSALINQYLKFISELDYNAQVQRDGRHITITYGNNVEDILIDDLARESATRSSSAAFNNDPMTIVYEDIGPVYYRGQQQDGPVIVQQVGETLEQYQQRLSNWSAYFTLGSAFKSSIDERIQRLLSDTDDQIIEALRAFQKESALILQKICE